MPDFHAASEATIDETGQVSIDGKPVPYHTGYGVTPVVTPDIGNGGTTLRVKANSDGTGTITFDPADGCNAALVWLPIVVLDKLTAHPAGSRLLTQAPEPAEHGDHDGRR